MVTMLLCVYYQGGVPGRATVPTYITPFAYGLVSLRLLVQPMRNTQRERMERYTSNSHPGFPARLLSGKFGTCLFRRERDNYKTIAIAARNEGRG